MRTVLICLCLTVLYLSCYSQENSDLPTRVCWGNYCQLSSALIQWYMRADRRDGDYPESWTTNSMLTDTVVSEIFNQDVSLLAMDAKRGVRRNIAHLVLCPMSLKGSEHYHRYSVWFPNADERLNMSLNLGATNVYDYFKGRIITIELDRNYPVIWCNSTNHRGVVNMLTAEADVYTLDVQTFNSLLKECKTRSKTSPPPDFKRGFRASP